MIKKFIFLVLFFSSCLFAKSIEVEYTPFIDAQLKIVKQMNDNNLTQEQIKSLVHKQEIMYDKAIDQLMINKNSFIADHPTFRSKIFSIKKVIRINKRANNTYAVLRDEVKLKSYRILQNQYQMIVDILLALDLKTKAEFEARINDAVARNKTQLKQITNKDYTPYLETTTSSKVLLQAQKNIMDYYALQDINNDIISYLYKDEGKMYRLNKYSKYHLINVVMYINSIAVVNVVNDLLDDYGLNVMKLMAIFILLLFAYFLKRIVYVAFESYILKIDILSKYSLAILTKIRKPTNNVIIIVALNMMVYIYNDFSSVDIVAKFFNMLYGFYFTYVLYLTLNTVASIKLSEIDNKNTRIKSDMINVGLKILNFFIMVIGLLIILYFAGVDLTAVLSGLGIGGFAVAFAAKDTISNFFGTLSILFSDTFEQGDWIEIDGYEGVVVEIGLRVTTLRTFDNALISIPNGTVANKDVKNWDKRKLGRRIKMYIGVKYDSKAEDIENVIKQIKSMLVKHPKIATKETKYEHKSNVKVAKLVSKDDLEGVKKLLMVYLDDFSASSINILVYCFVKSVQWEDFLATKQDVMFKIMDILKENSLEFAYPSMSIYHENNK